MDGDGIKVQVYIYDVTKGLAAQLSPMFLGKRLVCHTPVSVVS